MGANQPAFVWNLLQNDLFSLNGEGSATGFGAVAEQVGSTSIVGAGYGVQVRVLGAFGIALIAAVCNPRLRSQGAANPSPSPVG